MVAQSDPSHTLEKRFRLPAWPACVVDVVSPSTKQDDCSFHRARDTLLSERAR